MRGGAQRYIVLSKRASRDTLASPNYLSRFYAISRCALPRIKSNTGICAAHCATGPVSPTGTRGASRRARDSPLSGAATELNDWLLRAVLPRLPGRRGLASAHILVSTLAVQMTLEQRIRGKDDALHSALIVTGYDADAIGRLADGELQAGAFIAHGASNAGFACSIYDQVYSLDAAGHHGNRS